jgi:subtilisin-like proprotein convertase family protein/N-acetylneuraminic acid mutarotase
MSATRHRLVMIWLLLPVVIVLALVAAASATATAPRVAAPAAGFGPLAPDGMTSMTEIEPNNAITTANIILPGESGLVISAAITPTGDIDVFGFYATAGQHLYAATMTAAQRVPGSGNSALYLVRSDDTLVEEDQDDGSFSPPASSLAGVPIPATGMYYLRVRMPNDTEPVDPYQLYVRLTSATPAAESEPNNSPAQANALTLPGLITATITLTSPVESDWYSFSLNAGESVYISLDENPERDGFNTEARLGVGPVEPVFYLGDYSNPPNSKALFYTASRTGTHYIYIANQVPNSCGPECTYQLSVTKAPTASTQGCVVYSNNVPLPLPAQGTVTSTLNIPVGMIVNNISVRLSITHTSVGALNLSLRAPGGQRQYLFTGIGGGSANFVNTWIEENAAVPIYAWGAPFTGSFMPEPLNGLGSNGGTLTAFNGTNSQGAWSLVLQNGYPAPGSQLNSWGLQVCGTFPTVTPGPGTATATRTGTPPAPTATATPFCTPPPAAGAWATVAALPTAAYGLGLESDQSYAYAAGGYNIVAGAPVNQFARYDPVANAWTMMAPVPDSVSEMELVYANNKLYGLGGLNGANEALNTTRIYDIVNNVWITARPMPGVRRGAAVGYYNGKVYVVGGFDSNAVTPQNQTWEYDIAANTWTARAPLPAALGGATGAVLGGHLYVIGGRDTVNSALDTVYDYNISLNSWTQRASLQVARNAAGGAVTKGRIWVFGGGQPLLGAERPETIGSTEIYDPYRDSWTFGPSQNQDRSFQGGTAIRNIVVSGGGYSAFNSVSTTEVSVGTALRVLIVYDDSNTAPAALRTQLLAQSGVGTVDTFNGQTGTPTLAQLRAYDVVVVVSGNTSWSSAATLGNNLADYLDNGGVAVVFNFAWYGTGPGVEGRWLTGGYTPYASPGAILFSNGSLGGYEADHPLMIGVTTLNSFYRETLALTAGAQQVAAWSSGQPLVAYKGRTIGVSAYVGDSLGQWNGDYARLVANAGFWLTAEGSRCVAYATATPPATDTPTPGPSPTSTPGPSPTPTGSPAFKLYLPAAFYNANAP